MLARPELEQLAQRVIARYHLGPCPRRKPAATSRTAWRWPAPAAACRSRAALMALIHRLTGGVPRRINLLCDRALLGAYVENSRAGDAADPTPRRRRGIRREQGAARRRRWPLAAAVLLAAPPPRPPAGSCRQRARSVKVVEGGAGGAKPAAVAPTPPPRLSPRRTAATARRHPGLRQHRRRHAGTGRAVGRQAGRRHAMPGGPESEPALPPGQGRPVRTAPARPAGHPDPARRRAGAATWCWPN